MKKFLTLVLALVFALALTVPAMAFTSVTADEDTPYELDIYLVEHEDDSFFGLVGLPPSDRGYAKNEIVAAIVEIVVPKDEDLGADFDSLVLSGENVSLKVIENNIAAGDATLYTSKGDKLFAYSTADDELSTDALAIYDTGDSKTTVKVLFFAKVTDDDASLTATLNADDSSFGTLGASYSSLTNALIVGDYVVKHTSNSFLVYDKDSFSPDPADAVKLFEITVNDDNETEDLFIYDEDGVKYLAVNPEGGVFYNAAGSTRITNNSIIRDLQAIYEDAFVEDFGFDFSVSGGILKESFFSDVNGSDDVEATVEIKPWTAYVTVPDNIVVDPPKTGDAASIVGFVMIVLAAAAVVAVKKVRA